MPRSSGSSSSGPAPKPGSTLNPGSASRRGSAPKPGPASKRGSAPRRKSAAAAAAATPTRPPRKSVPKCNGLDGKRWLQNSISVWSDIRKTADEQRLKHPALFPQQLVERLIETFLPPTGDVILDPFAGIGSTLLAATRMGKRSVGFELSPEFTATTLRRLAELARGGADASGSVLYQESAARLAERVPPESIDLCITSPPYWNILLQRRTADLKAIRHYGEQPDDLGTIADYDTFLDRLTVVYADVFRALKPGAYCCSVVMDLRKKDRFYPFHSDLASRLQDVGFIFDDLIIWNRQSEYNNLRPLGYPAVFRVNKVHEFVVLARKPA